MFMAEPMPHVEPRDLPFGELFPADLTVVAHSSWHQHTQSTLAPPLFAFPLQRLCCA